MEEGFDKSPPRPRSEFRYYSHRELERFAADTFVSLNVPKEDAEITAKVLVTADLRGISSHGIARLKRYVDGIVNGVVKVKPKVKIVKEGAVYAVLDADYGLGQPVSYRAMRIAIEKAAENGVGAVTVRNSNHYGIAGYYAMMALERDMIGISLTNSRPLVAPTGSVERLIGTNPIAFAAPTEKEPPFVLDMATSVVPIGKLEVYRRLGKKIPEGWAINSQGDYETNPDNVISSGALLPLGGLGELFGGHKGYGLSLMVDILSGLLSGSNWGVDVGPTQGPSPSKVGHFFAAINIESFIDIHEFKRNMEKYKALLKSSKLHPDFKRVWIHGEKSWLTAKTRLKKGIPVHIKTVKMMNLIAEQLGIKPPAELPSE